MSEMTTEAEPVEDNSEENNGKTREPSSETPNIEQTDNPGVEKAPNPDGDPNNDRMGAPAVMPG